MGPEVAQEHLVARELPVAVHLHDAAHLPIGGCAGKLLCPFDGQVDAEAHQPAGIGRVAELDLAHGAGQVAEEEGGRLLVVPDVRAGAVAAALLIAAALPAVEAAVGRAEARPAAQAAQVEERGLP